MTTLAEQVDAVWPRRGPCLICGVPGEDARHRVMDAVVDRVEAGESMDDVAEDYGVSRDAITLAVAWADAEIDKAARDHYDRTILGREPRGTT